MPDLITHAELKALCFLNGSDTAGVEPRKTGAAIQDAHHELKKVLGRTGYALVYANAPTFAAQTPNSALYVTLLTNYIKPFMAWRVKQRATIDMHMEADRGGYYKKGGQDYTPVSASELNKAEAVAQGRADDRLEDLLDYLEENKAVFTWMDTTEEGEERIAAGNKTVAGVSFRVSPKQGSYRG